MRAMAHPARLAILDFLAEGQHATATECAEVCGLSPSATSYHLRALAKAGLIEEAPSRGDGRERLWRSRAGGGFAVDPGEGETSEARSAALDLAGVVLDRDDAKVRAWLARSHEEPAQWRAVAEIAGSALLVTPDELARLMRGLHDLLRPYQQKTRVDAPAQARRVSFRYRVFPTD